MCDERTPMSRSGTFFYMRLTFNDIFYETHAFSELMFVFMDQTVNAP